MNSCLGISSPIGVLPNLYKLPKLDRQQHELGKWKSKMTWTYWSLHILGLNHCLMLNLYNAMYEVSDLCWLLCSLFMQWFCHSTTSRLISGGHKMEISKLRKQVILFIRCIYLSMDFLFFEFLFLPRVFEM